MKLTELFMKFYLKLGCRQGYGNGLQLHAYTDSSCKTKASQVYYNQDIDLQNMKVGFGQCNNCERQVYRYNNNGNNQNNGNNRNNYYGNNRNNYYGNNNNNQNNNFYYNSQYSHSSPLCSAAFHYRKSCLIGCRIAAHKAKSSNPYGYNYNNNRNNGGANNNMYNNNYSNYNPYGNYDDGFSSVGICFLWILSLTGMFMIINFCVKGVIICHSTQSHFELYYYNVRCFLPIQRSFAAPKAFKVDYCVRGSRC